MYERLMSLYRVALRSGNRRLAEQLARVVRGDPALRERTDMSLQELPRGPARSSAAGERVVRRVMDRLGGFLL